MTNKKPALSASVLAAVGLVACEPKVVACLSAIDTEQIDTDDFGVCLDTDVDEHSDTETWGPCLDLAPTAHTGVDPETDTDRDTWSPCLDFPPPHTGETDDTDDTDDTDTYGPCLDTDGDTDTWVSCLDTAPPHSDTWGPCLNWTSTWDTGPPNDSSPTGDLDTYWSCLDTYLRVDSDTDTGNVSPPAPTAHTGDTAPDRDTDLVDTGFDSPCLTDDPSQWHSDTAASVTVLQDTAAPPPRSAAIRAVLASTDLPDDVAAALAARTEEP